MEKSYQVYILTNPDGRTYIGLSEDPWKRLEQHNRGESKWTTKYRPWSLDWLSHPMSLTSTRKLENLLKRQNGGRGLRKLRQLYGSSSKARTNH